MKVLSLFSGGGLGDLGLLAAGMEIVAQVEIDEYCQKVLALRYPDSVKYKNVKEVNGEKIRAEVGAVDVLAGGFPCQPFSVAGNQRGDQDDRHLWPEMFRIIQEVKPTYVIGENVPGLIGIALDDVLNDLERAGYVCATFVFPAHACGAPHRRDRLWIIGYSKHDGQPPAKISGGITQGNGGGSTGSIKAGKPEGSDRQRTFMADTDGERCDKGPDVPGEKRKKTGRNKSAKCGKTLGDSDGSREQQQKRFLDHFRGRVGDAGWWDIEPDVGRVAYGVPSRVDRLKLLGNGQVVHCTKFLGDIIMEFNKKQKESV